MKGTHLGEFEEIVLEELSERLERPISPGVVHQTMQRLAEKGLVHSRFSEPIAEPGGRSKRLFTVTVAGEQPCVKHNVSGMNCGMVFRKPLLATHYEAAPHIREEWQPGKRRKLAYERY